MANIVLNGMMILNNELEVMWEETVVAYLRHYPSSLPEGLRKTTIHLSE